jgi:hypothetical protein
MKKVLLTLLGVIVILGALAGAGLAGYRIGFNQGVMTSGNSPFVGRGEQMHPNVMPNVDRNFGFRSQPFRSPMMMERGNFGIRIFSPLRILWNVAILALIIWFIYWLFTKSGWRITHQTKVTEVSETKIEG